ncbi:hypothetical protein PIROE2DRAFT_10873, partial [Piromyces sp. E2]
MKMDSREISIISPVIASAIMEIPNDYTLSSKIYKNGNVISYLPENNTIDNITNRENLIRLMILNYTKLFTKNKKKSKPFKYNTMSFVDNDYNPSYYSRSCPVCDSPTPLPSSSPSPRVNMRISSNKYSSSSSSSTPIQEIHDSFSLDEKINKYNTTISNTHHKKLNYDDNNQVVINKNGDFDIQNLNCKVIGDKIHLSFTIITPETESQSYKL